MPPAAPESRPIQRGDRGYLGYRVRQEHLIGLEQLGRAIEDSEQ